jgi:serine protease Do
MRRLLLLLPLLCPAPAATAGDDEHGLTLLQQAEARVRKAAQEAGPSIACILVSRSPDYHTAPYWGVPAAPDQPGRLGRFDAAAAREKVPNDAPHRARLLRTIGQLNLADPDAVPESYGSGFVVDRSGLVLTNAHVVQNATRVYVRLPGKRGSWADIHASDPRSDLAVLKLLDPPADLTALELGRGEDVRTGRFVLSLANSYAPGFKAGDAPTADWGLVSNLRQKIVEGGRQNEMDLSRKPLHHFGTLIQTDARTTPACSGGALLDLRGQAVGITTALAGVRGDRPGGFALPFDKNTRRIVEVLKRGEEVEYGFLGVSVREILGGVMVETVTHGSPAYRADIQNGDQIVAIDGVRILKNDDLFLQIGMALAGTTVKVRLARSGFRPSEITVTATLAKFNVRGPIITSKRPPARFGLRVDHLSIYWQNMPLFRAFGRRATVQPTKGVVVREVVPNSPADEKRFDDTKVITHVDGQEVNTPAAFYKAIAEAGKSVELTYLRSDGEPATLTLEEK